MLEVSKLLKTHKNRNKTLKVTVKFQLTTSTLLRVAVKLFVKSITPTKHGFKLREAISYADPVSRI